MVSGPVVVVTGLGGFMSKGKDSNGGVMELASIGVESAVTDDSSSETMAGSGEGASLVR